MPSISSDHARDIINIGYLSAQQDPYQHRYQLFQAQIGPGVYGVSAQQVVAALADEPAADPLLGPGDLVGPGQIVLGAYIGVAARSTGNQSRVYFGFTGQIYKGLLRGQMVSGSNNLLSAVSY
jgi:hypothetical protein